MSPLLLLLLLPIIVSTSTYSPQDQQCVDELISLHKCFSMDESLDLDVLPSSNKSENVAAYLSLGHILNCVGERKCLKLRHYTDYLNDEFSLMVLWQAVPESCDAIFRKTLDGCVPAGERDCDKLGAPLITCIEKVVLEHQEECSVASIPTIEKYVKTKTTACQMRKMLAAEIEKYGLDFDRL